MSTNDLCSTFSQIKERGVMENYTLHIQVYEQHFSDGENIGDHMLQDAIFMS